MSSPPCISSEPTPLWLAGVHRTTPHLIPVLNKWTGQCAAHVCAADPALLEQAVESAVAAEAPMREMTTATRSAALHHVAHRIAAQSDRFADLIVLDSGKSITSARAEVQRAINTFQLAAAESSRITGEFMQLDSLPANAGLSAISMRVPVGACSFITPFNFPLNLVAHKVAPAIAARCPFILKPAPATPLTALLLGEILAELDLPTGAWSITPCSNQHASVLVTDDRIKLLSFTGSADIGWKLKAQAGRKRLVLELGGNAACIIDQDADIPLVLQRLIVGGFSQSGQSCISVQRVLVHSSLYQQLRQELVQLAAALPTGDPFDPATVIGPMISADAAARMARWVQAAQLAGGTILCGAQLNATVYHATILENVPHHCDLWKEEAFGPVIAIEPFSSFHDALSTVNDSRYGLQASVFTNRLDHALAAWRTLHVGAVVINDVPSIRADEMPYGGVKDSGLGREGVRSSILELTDERLLVLRNSTPR